MMLFQSVNSYYIFHLNFNPNILQFLGGTSLYLALSFPFLDSYKLPKIIDSVIIVSSLKIIHRLCIVLWMNIKLWI